MAVLLIFLYPMVVTIGIFTLWLVSPEVREKIKIPKSKAEVVIPFIFFFSGGNLGYLLAPNLFYPLKLFLVIGICIFCFYNFRVFGLFLAGIGYFLNFLVMAGNGMKMPILPEVAQNIENKVYVPISSNTFLPQLGDIFKVSDGFSTLVLSIGDIILYIGLTLTVFYLMFVALKGALKEDRA